MADLKTKPTKNSVEAYLAQVEDDQRRTDSFALLTLMTEVTGYEGQMWGNSIIGFGQYHYKYKSGREGEWFLVGFAPRKQKLTLYIMPGFEKYDGLLAKLGKHKTGKSCLYLNKLADVDTAVLKDLIAQSVAHMQATYPTTP